MAAKFKHAIGVDSRLIPEGRGIFDVVIDDELVFSKFKTGTFPDETELVKIAAQKFERSNK